jgi:hypothetical protein
MKQLIISDLYRILYNFPLESDPDNWDLRVMLANALLTHHGLFFKDADEIEESQYWATGDVSAKFYDLMCPAKVPTITAFENVCNDYFAFEHFEKVQAVKKLSNALDIMPAIKAITDEYACDMCNNDTDLDKHLEIPSQQEMEKALRTIQKAA